MIAGDGDILVGMHMYSSEPGLQASLRDLTSSWKSTEPWIAVQGLGMREGVIEPKFLSPVQMEGS